MVTHMAVQLPLLLIVGGYAMVMLQQSYPRLTKTARRYRSPLLLLALFTLAIWMLPYLLDLALHRAEVEIIKWLSLPLAGMALVMSWQHLPVVLRGVLHVEAIATLLRLGWLYLIAPERYCVNYLIGDQVLLGYLLLCYGMLYALYLGYKVMFSGSVHQGIAV